MLRCLPLKLLSWRPCFPNPLSRLTVDQMEALPRLETWKERVLARKVSVYDGDTLTLVVQVNGRLFRRRCRCVGYDAPELKGQNAETEAARAARDYLVSLTPEGVFYVDCHGHDKYGRLLVEWEVQSTSDPTSRVPLREEMILRGHGYAYQGGRKRVKGVAGSG